MSFSLLTRAPADADGFDALTFLRRSGPYAVFAAAEPGVEALKFDPLGAGRLEAMTGEAADALARTERRFLKLGERLRALKLEGGPDIQAVRRWPDGCYWLQRSRAVTLEAWLAEHPGPLSPPVLAAFVRALGRAMAALHGQGLIHGAISPRTIHIDGGIVSFTQFGVDTRAFFRILRGQDGLVDPGYAPPEAHDGAQRQPLGAAADVYGASAVVLRLLTGAEPPAANGVARVTGASVWPEGFTPPEGMGAAVEAGLAMAASDRPADWLAAFDLGPPEPGAWFDGTAEAAETDETDETDEFAIPEAPREALPDFGPVYAAEDRPAPPPAPPRRGRRALLAGGLIAATAVGAAWGLMRWAGQPEPAAPAPVAAAAAPAPVPTPAAPAGCSWIASGPSAWRLSCSGDPAAAITLPERFGVRTVAQAEQGDVAAMERLGTFYRLRAKGLGAQAGAPYAYQAYDWLGRAADAGADARGEAARARDDAALALGAMLARGEGGRAPDPAAAESRLRQAAAGDRADAVYALGAFLKSAAGDDPKRLSEARELLQRVAQLNDGSSLQQRAADAVAAMDAAAKAAEPAPPPAPPPEPAPPPKPAAVAPKPEPKPEPKPKPAAKAPTAKAPPPPTKTAKPAAPPPPAKAAPLKPPPKPAPPPAKPRPAPRPSASSGGWGLSPRAAPFSFGPSRSWSASAFVQVDPDSDFSGAIQRAGRDLCRSQGGEAASVRQGEVICPNGVYYCQVRAVAACEGR